MKTAEDSIDSSQVDVPSIWTIQRLNAMPRETDLSQNNGDKMPADQHTQLVIVR